MKVLNEKLDALFELDLLNEIKAIGVQKDIQDDEILMDYGKTIRSIPILLSGAIKVFREDENGDELLLYFLEEGDTCAMTMTCCLGNSTSKIRAVAESETKLIMIPVEKMELWMSKYATWRKFVLESYHIRFNELLETIDNLAFLNMDERLINYLKSKSKVNKANIIAATHQDIAIELNTSRVVISRLLKKLENKGNIHLSRNQIEVITL
ncbi:MAG: Crp/Fnr family transcriptional regulator [Vicingaceae bacterium]